MPYNAKGKIGHRLFFICSPQKWVHFSDLIASNFPRRPLIKFSATKTSTYSAITGAKITLTINIMKGMDLKTVHHVERFIEQLAIAKLSFYRAHSFTNTIFLIEANIEGYSPKISSKRHFLNICIYIFSDKKCYKNSKKS
jgi:hypothetical protein